MKLTLHTSEKIACVIGCTGLVGTELAVRLAKHTAYKEVLLISRSKPDYNLNSKHRWIKWSGELSAISQVLPKGDDFFSALGTTLKDAGSPSEFRSVDLDLNVAFAKTAFEKGYNQYLLVSSLGANPRSPFLYPRVKGKLELKIKALPFWSIHIIQPGLLLGNRDGKRIAEDVSKSLLSKLKFMLVGPLKRFKPIEASSLAATMVGLAQNTSEGVFVHSNADLFSFTLPQIEESNEQE